MKKGFSLIETLVVIGLFALIATVVARSTAFSLSGSRKSDTSSMVREELENAVGVVERHLRSAKSIDATSCTGLEMSSINYIDQSGAAATFTCVEDGDCSGTPDSQIAWSGSRLTSQQNICLRQCKFTCTQAVGNLPPTVKILVEGVAKGTTGVEGSAITVETSVTLRAY